ncbi:MAG: UvrB/UvrC motif-containing protein [Phycisphaerales bacterium]|nr:MAG: UvrB/UvrC motif-containing protein [Phycisphaerales bacterium]UCF15459.1 MAG: UvrB/UvrC motif-containing protein [Phycisphaerales bacterium]
MQCQICNKNDATIHLTEISGGARTEIHVCESCAVEQDIAVKSHIPINELLSNLLASQPTDEEISGATEQEVVCPNCGFTLAQFQKEGTLGCPADYEVFEKMLRPLIEKAHDGRTTHVGKIPSSTPLDTKEQMQLLNLRQRLEAAVQSEDYELAAKLRDEINKSEK